MMVARVLASRWFMLFLTCATLLLLIFLIYERVESILTTLHLEDYHLVLDDGETIAILLVGLGVVLESRSTLLRKSRSAAHIVHTKAESERELDFEYYGIIILIIGLLLEIGAQFIRFINTRLGFEGAPLLARLLMQGLGIVALIMLLRIIILLLTPDPSEELLDNE